VVDEVKKGRLLRGEFKNTGGTDIDCVYEHIVRLPPTRTPVRVLVLTDGMTGSPAPHLYQEWQQRKVRLYVGLVQPAFRNGLAPYAAHVEQFPSPVKD
jgi:predicted metal-dependent peptidase